MIFYLYKTYVAMIDWSALSEGSVQNLYSSAIIDIETPISIYPPVHKKV